MKNTLEREAPIGEPTIRANWPKGIFGWLAYLCDHGLYGFKRPVDWSSLWAFEQCGHGFPVFANGTVLILDSQEVDVLRLMAKGLRDSDIAASLSVAERAINKVSRKIKGRLGVAHHHEIAEIAATHGLR